MSERTPRVTGEEVVRALKRAGFEEQRQRGSHVHLRRVSDNQRITVPVHKGRTIPIGTLRAILRDADVSVDQLRELL